MGILGKSLGRFLSWTFIPLLLMSSYLPNTSTTICGFVSFFIILGKHIYIYIYSNIASPLFSLLTFLVHQLDLVYTFSFYHICFITPLLYFLIFFLLFSLSLTVFQFWKILAAFIPPTKVFFFLLFIQHNFRFTESYNIDT